MKNLCDKLEEVLEIGGMKKDIAFLIIGGVSLLLSIFRLPPDFLPDPAWIAIILCGVPITIEAFVGLVRDHDITADVLVALALWASVVIGETFAAGEVAFIMQLGGLLEELTVARARAGIEKLVHLTPQTARILMPDGSEKIVEAEEVKVGDILLVKPGETVAVDGAITKGETSINQAVMTGESLPVDKGVGDEVFSGTVNQYGAFEMKASRVGEDSSIQRMIRLVQSADAGKAKIVNLADRWAVWVVAGAAIIAILSYLFTQDLIRSVTVLVVFCPCALVLATPTAIMAGIGNVTKHGFLVREGDALERLAKVNCITFDKTGTLTYGTPEVTDVLSVDAKGREDLLRLVAGAESASEHPLGQAIVRAAKKEKMQISKAENFHMMPGYGVKAEVEGKSVVAGNLKLLNKEEISIDKSFVSSAEEYLAKGSTVIYIAVDDKFYGFVVMADLMREQCRAMIINLEGQEVRPVLLTGDNEKAAASIAGEAGIKDFQANCLPEDKIAFIEKTQSQGKRVCMIGDGINDAPSLKRADVGIAMGGVGSDIAVDAADIVLVDDDVKELPHLFALSKRMMKIIKINLTISMTLNFLAVALAVLGILNPVWGALVHNAGSVFVIINSSLLLTWKRG